MNRGNVIEFCDNYEHDNSNIEYILQNILSEDIFFNDNEYSNLKDDFNTVLLNKCQCSKAQTECINCSHGRNYIRDLDFGELILHPQKEFDLIYECSPLCTCDATKCLNRLVQLGPRKNLKIINSQRFKSKGVITTADIPCGAFICEYAGELLTRIQARKRIYRNDQNQEMNYILSMYELSSQSETVNSHQLTIIDPSKKGNIGRYLNHSCEPNCKIYSVRIDSPIPKIGIFSKRPIKSGEELCFHYNEGINENRLNYTSTSQRKTCLCGTRSCQRFLPNYEF